MGSDAIPHDGSSPTRIRRSCQGLVKTNVLRSCMSCWIAWRTISSRASPNLAKPMLGASTSTLQPESFRSLKSSAEAFARFVRQEKLRDKRNRAISHKELPETWSERRYIHIPYLVLLQAIAIAVRLMKRIDRVFLGPAAPYLWREARKRRYLPTAPGKVAYMLLPYLRLSNRDRSTVIDAELREGRGTWIPMKTRSTARM